MLLDILPPTDPPVQSSQTCKDFATWQTQAPPLSVPAVMHWFLILQALHTLWFTYVRILKGYWRIIASKMTEFLLVAATLPIVIGEKVCNTCIASKNILSCIISDMVAHVLTIPVFMTHSYSAFCVWKTEYLILTANHHHSNGKDLLPIRSRSDVPKSNTGEAGHREIQRGDVDWIFAWSAFPFSRAWHVKAVRCSYGHPQLVEPAVSSDLVCILIENFVVSYAVPNAGQPVRCKTKHTHQENQDCCSVFNVVVQLPSYATQAKEPDHFKWTEEATDALEG